MQLEYCWKRNIWHNLLLNIFRHFLIKTYDECIQTSNTTDLSMDVVEKYLITKTPLWSRMHWWGVFLWAVFIKESQELWHCWVHSKLIGNSSPMLMAYYYRKISMWYLKSEKTSYNTVMIILWLPILQLKTHMTGSMIMISSSGQNHCRM